MEANTLEDLVMVPIPRKHLAAVYELVARLEMGSTVNKEFVGTVEPTQGLATDWPDELIARAYVESSPAMKRVLNVLASRPDEVIDSQEVVREAFGQGGSWQKLAGTLGAFGNRVANRYGRSAWPFEARWSHELGLMTYVMPRRVANVIEGI